MRGDSRLGRTAAALVIALAAFGPEVRRLYFENQNTKYLHAFAQAGIGFLGEDWTAQTKDGLPLFTAIVKLILDSIGEHGFYFAAFITYFAFGVCAVLLHLRVSKSLRLPQWSLWIFTVLACVTATVPILKTIAFDGLAGQWILQGYFQASDFGILLIFSILCFSVRRFILATVSAVIPAIIHPGYVVPAATLLLIYAGFEISAARKSCASNWWIKLATLTLGLAALLAIALVLRRMFPPSSVEAYGEAHRLLTEYRMPHHTDPWQWIPHHTDPRRWIYNHALYKALICSVAVAVLPKGRLRFVVAAMSLATLVFVVVGLVPNLSTYKLITPWRISVALVPVAALVCLSVTTAKVTAFLEGRLDANASYYLVTLISAAIIAVCIVNGSIRAASSLRSPFPVYRDFVRNVLGPGQLYLTPPSYAEFRLLTGAPQYISYKTHPYLDIEVLEWYRRLRNADNFFNAPILECNELKRFLTMEKITHIITTSQHNVSACEFARPVFEKSGIVILQLDTSLLGARHGREQ